MVRSQVGLGHLAGYSAQPCHSSRGRCGLSKHEQPRPDPETTTIKLPRDPAICTMPQMITEQLLQAEGFTDIHFVDEPHLKPLAWLRPRAREPYGPRVEARQQPWRERLDARSRQRALL
jgi:hypothetical protein